MVELVEQLRATGLTMGGSYPARPWVDPENEEITGTQKLHIGWTTDQAKADAARDLGATVTSVRAHDPRFSGWEVSVNVIEGVAQ